MDPTLKQCLKVLSPYKGEYLGDIACYKMDVCASLYCFARDYHCGQWSNLYSIIGWLYNYGFRPGYNLDVVQEDGIAKMMYDDLVYHFSK